MPKSQLGGILYIFPPGPREGCLYFPLNTKVPCILLYNKGGVGPEGTQITKVCTNVHTCMYICHTCMYICILGILWAKMCPKITAILDFWSFGHKKTKNKNFQNRYIRFCTF